MSGEKKSWIAKLRCTVTKQVLLENCTEEEAEEDPFAHAVEEDELEQVDWEMLSLEENK